MFGLGRKGLNLVKPLTDLVPEECAQLLNLVSRNGSALTTRAGQTALATTSGVESVHSPFRLNDPGATTFTRLAGSSTGLYRGQSGPLTLVDSGYSGDPLTFAGLTVPLAGTPRVAISDRSRQRVIDRTGTIQPFGIPPAVLTSTTLGTQLEKEICQFEAADPNGASAAAQWTMTAGTDRAGTATAAPTAADVMGAGNLLVQITTNPAGAAAGLGYYSVASIARTLDLSTFDGTTPITDDDILYIAMNISQPKYLEQITVYLVCSTFTAGGVPGKDATNGQAYYKSFGPNDFTDFHTQQASALEASQTLRTNTLLGDFADEASVTDPRTEEITPSITETARVTTPQFPAGINVWGEWGVQGISLRRGDWARVGVQSLTGSTPADWSTITGIVIVITTNTNQPITWTSPDLWAVRGGSGPDVMEADAQPYDYRVINRHSLTGSKGNPSAIQATADELNPLRQPVLVQPTASGVADMRQWAYRRGGGANTSGDWYLVGVNTSDGGLITDTVGDAEALTAETLEIDNDQPVTTVNASGVTVLNQTLPIYFIVDDYCFGLGDPYQPGRLYRSKKGAMEAWPATAYLDVCPSGDELMNGGAYASIGFVFSRNRLYTLVLNADGSWDFDPTSCAEGLVARWAMVVTPFGIAFVSPFGVRLTQGGDPTDLSSAQLLPLFQGQTANGMAPINFTVPTALRLEYHDHELWFTYQPTSGTRRHLIYNFQDQTWRPYTFSEAVASVYSEPVQGVAASLLLGGHATGQLYTHSGFSDDGTAIPYQAVTGAWDFGQPRNEKTYSEVVLDGELQTATVTLSPYLNDALTTVTPMTAVGVAGSRRYTFEPFGTVPQRARNVTIGLSGNAPTGASLAFNRLGVTTLLQPEIVYRQPTPWEELQGGEGYCFGMLITCNTGGVDKAVDVEYTIRNSAVTVAASLTINADGRRKLPFTWPAVLASQMRLIGTADCEPWMRFKIEWLSQPEPPRVADWNTNWDAFGTFTDKWLKGLLIEADTFNAAKTLLLDIDQSLAVVTQAMTFNGRAIQQFSFAKQRGRLFRLRSIDGVLAKLYRWQPIFDEEPLSLTRWESEERPFVGMAGRWQKPLEAFVCLRSAATVTWTMTVYGVGTSALQTRVYTIATTGGVKQKVRVPFEFAKGLLFQHLFTASSGFWLYREESEVLVEDWSTGQAQWVPLFIANDDTDPARAMGNSVIAAQTPGGA